MSDPARLRPDYDWLRIARRESRSLDRIVAHFELERRLAEQLKASRRDERTLLYGRIYGELFQTLPDHPQNSITSETRARQAGMQLRVIAPLLTKSCDVIEIGCGDAVLTKAIALQVRSAIGVDVTDRLVESERPTNFTLRVSDGVNLPLESDSADLVISNHLIEHMHDDDVLPHFEEVRRVLRTGGRYLCATPNRLMGPHDISVFFGYKPCGFHLREYDHRSLSRVFRQAKFANIRALGLIKGKRYDVPLPIVGGAEALIDGAPDALRKRLMRVNHLYRLNQVMIMGASQG